MFKGIEVESLEFRETFQLSSGIEPSTTDAVETTTSPGLSLSSITEVMHYSL